MIDTANFTHEQIQELARIESERSEINEQFEQATRQAYANRAEAEIVYGDFLQAFCAGELPDDFTAERIEQICFAAGVTAEQFGQQAAELSAIYSRRRMDEVFFAHRMEAARQAGMQRAYGSY